MASYAVDSRRQEMTATGIVEAVHDWEEAADGRRRPSEHQARDENTGMPLWAVEVLYTQTSYGRESSLTAKVTVGSVDKPTPARLAPVEFADLRVELRLNKAGGFVEYWSADALAEQAKAVSKATTPSGSSASSAPAAA
jgi:hypothetical protein